MAGDEETAKALRITFAEEGIQLERVSGARNLGCDTNDGMRRRTGEQDARWAKAARAAGRVQVLRAAGAKTSGRLQRSSPTVTALWGSAVTGVADQKLHQLRIQVAKAEGRLPRGAVAYLRVGQQAQPMRVGRKRGSPSVGHVRR